jgi:serine/threonine-protein kinase RsbW
MTTRSALETAPAQPAPSHPTRQTPVIFRAAADAPAAPSLRHAVVDYARSIGMASRGHDVALAVGEALANVVLHAYAGRAAGEVRLSAERAGETLLVTVSDDGVGMRPRTDSPGLGLGLALMGAVADHCAVHVRPEGGTDVVLHFVGARSRP